MPIYVHVLGLIPNGRHFDKTPKKHILARIDVIRHIHHQNWLTGAICARDKEIKRDKEKNPCGKLHVRLDKPLSHHQIKIKFCMGYLFFKCHSVSSYIKLHKVISESAGWSKCVCLHCFGHWLYTRACTTIQTMIT